MVDLHTRSYGDSDNPALVLLHGLFGASANWGSTARRLADRYFVLVPDLRNHGQSPHTGVHSYPAMAEDLRVLLAHHSVERPTIVGHSMGGKVGMQFALEQPALVERLAVVDMAPVSYTHDFEDVLRAFDVVQLDRINSRSDADRQMAAVLPVQGLRAFLLQNLVRRDAGWRWRVNLDALRAEQGTITAFPTHAPGSRFDGPVGFIYGSLSTYVRPSHWSTIHRLFPDADGCEVEGAGHWVYADRPEEFMNCLEGFLAR